MKRVHLLLSWCAERAKTNIYMDIDMEPRTTNDAHQGGRRDAPLASGATRVLRLVAHLHHHLLLIGLAAAVFLVLKDEARRCTKS